jgi:hypothetical protein
MVVQREIAGILGSAQSAGAFDRANEIAERERHQHASITWRLRARRGKAALKTR